MKTLRGHMTTPSLAYIDRLKASFRELEFRTMLARVFGEKAAKIPADIGQISMFDQASEKKIEARMDEIGSEDQFTNLEGGRVKYEFLLNESSRMKLIDQLLKKKSFAFYSITSGIDPISDSIIGLAFCSAPGEAVCGPMPEKQKEGKKSLAEFQN